MIIDRIKNAGLYYGLGSRFETALKWLGKTDLAGLDAGVYQVDGENVFVQVAEYDTLPLEQCKFEVHVKYVDIQMFPVGGERIGYTHLSNCKETIMPYDTARDLVFYGRTDCDYVTVTGDTFIILYPEDAHMGKIQIETSERVKRIVCKVLL